MSSDLITREKLLLFFMPDYIFKSLKAQGISLVDLVYSSKYEHYMLKNDNPGEKNLKQKITDSLSKQDYSDLIIANTIGSNLLSHSIMKNWEQDHFKINDDIIASMILYNTFHDPDAHYKLTNKAAREHISSMVDNRHPVLEKSMEENDLVQFEVVDNILFVVFKKGFYNISLISFTNFQELFISSLLIFLFRFFSEENILNSDIFASILRIFYKTA